MKNEGRRTYIIPDPPDDYQAYLYKWHVWNEELGRYHFYVGRKHQRYHRVNYSHSSEDARFKNDLARSRKVIFEILQYGGHEEMGLAETVTLKNVKNSEGTIVGAAAADDWYNKTNGGGKYAKGSVSTVALDKLWDLISPMLEEHEKYEMNSSNEGIVKTFIKKDKLKYLIDNRQFLQTRDQEFDPSHVEILAEKTSENADPDEWAPIVLLNDCKIVNNKPSHEEGSCSIWNGNHRSRGNVKSHDGIGLNAYLVPYSLWKELSQIDFITFGNRCNPDQDKPELSQTPESAATWMAGFVKQKGLYKKSDDGEKSVPDYEHALITKELRSNLKFTKKKIDRSITIAKRRDEQQLLLEAGENLLDFSDKGLKENPSLKEAYDKKIAHYTDKSDPNCYDWTYKISGDIFKIGKVIEEIRRNNYGKKGLVLVHHKTIDQRGGEVYRKLRDTFERDVSGLLKDDFCIVIKDLPLTTSEARAEGYID